MLHVTMYIEIVEFTFIKYFIMYTCTIYMYIHLYDYEVLCLHVHLIQIKNHFSI